MSNFQRIKHGSDSSNNSDDTINVYLYPNRSKVDDSCEGAFASGLDELGQRALAIDACEEYNVYISYEHPALDASSKDTFWNEWTSYNIDSVDGCHMAATDAEIGGLANSPYNTGAFTSPVKAIVGYTNPKEYAKNVAVHEALHTFMNQQHLNADHGDHDAGTVYGDGSVSPMATGYVSSHARHDPCSTQNAHLGFYTTKMTSCTKSALKSTADNA